MYCANKANKIVNKTNEISMANKITNKESEIFTGVWSLKVSLFFNDDNLFPGMVCAILSAL